jgi:hypothetical protein
VQFQFVRIQALNAGARFLTVQLRPADSFSHPLHGDIAATPSSFVVRVVRRTQKGTGKVHSFCVAFAPPFAH